MINQPGARFFLRFLQLQSMVTNYLQQIPILTCRYYMNNLYFMRFVCLCYGCSTWLSCFGQEPERPVVERSVILHNDDRYQHIRDAIIGSEGQLRTGSYNAEVAFESTGQDLGESVLFSIYEVFDKEAGKRRFDRLTKSERSRAASFPNTHGEEARFKMIESTDGRLLWNPAAHALYQSPLAVDVPSYKTQLAPINLYSWAFLYPHEHNQPWPEFVVALDRIWKNQDLKITGLEESEDVAVVQWENGGSVFTIRVDKTHDWTVSHFKSVVDRPEEYGGLTVELENNIQWEFHNGAYVPVSVQSYSYSGYGADSHVKTSTVTFVWNSVNDPVDQSLFEEESLGVPQETIVVDYSLPTPAVVRRVGEDRAVRAQKFLAASGLNTIEQQPAVKSNGVRVLLWLNALILCAIAVVFIARRFCLR